MNKKIISHPTSISPRTYDPCCSSQFAHYLRGLPALDVDTVVLVLELADNPLFSAAAIFGATTTIAAAFARIDALRKDNTDDKNKAIAAQALLIVGEMAQIMGVATGEAMFDDHGLHVKSAISGTYGVAVAAACESILLRVEIGRLNEMAKEMPEHAFAIQKRASRYNSRIVTNTIFTIGSGLGATGVAFDSPLLQYPGAALVGLSIIKGVTDNATRTKPILTSQFTPEVQHLIKTDSAFYSELTSTFGMLCEYESSARDVGKLASWMSSAITIESSTTRGACRSLCQRNGFMGAVGSKVGSVLRLGGILSGPIKRSFAASHLRVGSVQDTVVNNGALKFLSYTHLPDEKLGATIRSLSPEGIENNSTSSSLLFALTLKEMEYSWEEFVEYSGRHTSLNIEALQKNESDAKLFLGEFVGKAKEVYYRIGEGVITEMHMSHGRRVVLAEGLRVAEAV